MAAERVVLVLGGGGMKGLSHVGAWRAILEAGIRPDEIVGTSIGALIGALIAGGADHDRLVTLARALTKTDIVVLNRWALLFNGIRQPSVFRDDTFRAYIESILPVETFAELGMPLAVNAVDLETGREEWFGAGGMMDVPLVDAVYASCALPVFYPPALIDNRYFVDGGVVDSLAVRHAVRRGADHIIAVDVGAGPAGDSVAAVEKGMVAIHQRVMQIMGYTRKRALLDAHGHARITYIRPHLDGYGTFDFNSTEYFLAEGYRAAAEALTGTSPTASTARDAAQARIEALRLDLLETPITLPDGQTLHISFSAGVSGTQADVGVEDSKILIDIADRRLLAAKRAGRARVYGADVIERQAVPSV